MVSYKLQECKTPWCANKVSIKINNKNKKNLYCGSCRSRHEKQVLELQFYHEKGIKNIILDEARMFNFKSLSILSDALESNIGCVRVWIKKYFDMTWDEFRQHYNCNYTDCIRFNMSDVKNKYYLRQKIKDERICTCLTKDNCLLIKPKNESCIKTVENLIEKYK